MARNLLSAREIVLFATNTGRLYETHLKMIRDHATVMAWEGHVILTVLPAYRRDCRDRLATMNDATVEDAAAQLLLYYMDHVAEIETADAA
jgi:hypothetical protein